MSFAKNSKEDPRFRSTEISLQITAIEHRTKYTVLSKPESAQELYDMRNGKCSLVIIDDSGADHPPFSVTSFEAFKNRPFDELWEMVTTPRWNLAQRRNIKNSTAKYNDSLCKAAGGLYYAFVYGRENDMFPFPPAVYTY